MNYTLNQELNGIEISFDHKPERETLNALKQAGFRWHRVKKLWYAKNTPARLTLADNLTNNRGISLDDFSEALQALQETKSDRQAELKDLYKKLISEYWKDAKMVDHCVKSAAYIVELENGDITEIEKPHIETRFCFGYGYCGVSTEEDYRNAADMMHYADTHEDYFISENMKDINGYIESLKDDKIRVFKYVHYCGKCDIRLKSIGFYRYYEEPANNLVDCKELTIQERQALIDGYEIVKKQFEKRLQTYLKKYGLTKLKTWTYLSD